MTDKTELEVTSLRDLIVEVAADLSADNPYWTAGCLADALIAKGVGLTTRTPDPTPVAWMPIESAPKGREVLINCARWGVTVAVLGDGGWQIAAFNGGCYSGNPTEWMPIPPAPNHTEDTPGIAPPAVPADGLVGLLNALAGDCDEGENNSWEHHEWMDAARLLRHAAAALAAHRGEA